MTSILEKAKLSGDQKSHLIAFWEKKRGEAHHVLVKQSRSQNDLVSFQWRVDVKASSKNEETSEAKNEPSAIVEMLVGKRTGNDEDNNVILFEMNKQQLQDAIATLDDLNDILQQKSNH